MLNSIKTNITLLFQTPKDYLYSYKYSDREPVKIHPFKSDTYITAQDLIKKLKIVLPNLKFYLIGSTGLQIEGVGDIDLYATTQFSEFGEVIPKISFIFGQPSKERKYFAEWHFDFLGYPVELKLRTPQDKYFQMQINLFNQLKGNQVYLYEYKSLKKKLNNGSRKDYARGRMEFFNRIISTSKNH